MAQYQAVAAVGQAILSLLADACPRPDFEGAHFELYHPRNFQQPMDLGLSLYLYRIAVNGARRNPPPAPAPPGRKRRPPLPIDLYYLLTPWAQSAIRQQRMLGWAIRELQATPVLPAAVLNRPGPERDIFRPEESVELVMESLSLQDLYTIWHVIKPAAQVSVSYVARYVAVDPDVEFAEGELVQTRVFEFAGGPR